jgi:WD40 repeat protein
VREIFDQAAEIASEAERLGFLDTACADDAEIRGQVEALLKAYKDAGSFLDRPALDVAEFEKSEQTEALANTPGERPTDAAVNAEPFAQKDHLPFLSPPTKPGSIGRLEHYQVHEVIGKGGFGIVLKAFDEKLHRIVAIKVLSPAYAANGSARKRFIREAQSAAVIKNEHVIAIYSVQDEAQPPYLVMELIDGVSLQDKLDEKGPLSLTEILRIGTQMAEGLAAAHKQGLVHRDIKPANILLENGVERVKITDFGLARAVDDASVSQSGTVAGTPMYMSPEQAEGLTIDHRSDLFSLGTVLYAMCTGHSPFRASGTHAVLRRVIDASPRPIREFNNEIPGWLCDTIVKLHAKKPEDRFQSAKEVAELLEQHLAHLQHPSKVPLPTVAKSPAMAPLAQAPTSPRARVRRRFGLAAAGLMLIALGLVAIFWGRDLVLLITNRGTLEFDVTADGVVMLDTKIQATRKGMGEVTIIDILRQNPIDLPAGEYELQVINKELDFKEKGKRILTPSPSDFTLGRGERQRIQFTFVKVDLAGKTDKDGWVQLFNGKNLSGWKLHPGDRGDWRVEDGLLVGRAVKGPSHLFSVRDDYENFHFRVEAKINKKGDSGQVFRCEYGLTPETMTWGYEANIGGLNEFKTGSLWGIDWPPVGPTEELIAPDTWFVQEVIARGNHIILKVNGKTTVDIVDPRTRYSRGHLALQAWALGTVVCFKKIEIKELPSSHTGKDACVALFNGKGLDGWVPFAFQEGANAGKAWQVAGQTVIGTGAPPGYLRTKKVYENYKLRLQWRMPRRQDPFPLGGSKDPWFDIFVHQSGPDRRTPSALRINLPYNGEGCMQSWDKDGTTRGDYFALKGRAKPLGEWNQTLITCKDGAVEVELNGEKLAQRACDLHKGAIALVLPGHEVHFRNVEIQELPPTPPGANWQPLFNGSLDGWEEHNGWPGDKKAWTWKGRKLVGEVLGGSYLISKRPYRDFELSFRVRGGSDEGIDCWVNVRSAAKGDTKLGRFVVGPCVPVDSKLGGFSTKANFDNTFKPPQNKEQLKFALIQSQGAADVFVRCYGKRVTVRVNGVTTIDEDFPDLPAEGVLAFHGLRVKGSRAALVEFQDIHILELPPPPAPAQPRASLGPHSGPVSVLAFSRDGKRLAICSDTTLKTWYVEAGKEASKEELTINLKSRLKAVTFSPAAAKFQLIGTATEDGSLIFWNFSGGKMGTHEMQGEAASSAAFSSDCKYLAMAKADGTITVWEVWDDARAKKVVATIPEKAAPITALAFSPDGLWLALARADKTVRLALLTKTGREVTLPAQSQRIIHLAFNADGSQLATVDEANIVRTWDTSTGQERRFLDPRRGKVTSIAYSNDRKTLAAGFADGKVQLWDIAAWDAASVVTNPGISQPFVLLSQDGKAEKKFATLTGAVLAAQSGDTIEIRGNGPFVSAPISITDIALTIRAGAGFQPVLKLGNQWSDSDVPLLYTNAWLMLEGVELHRVSQKPWQPGMPLRCTVWSMRAPLRIINCLFHQKGGTVCVYSDKQAKLCEVRNCAFLTVDSAVAWWSASGGQLIMDNCLHPGFHSLIVTYRGPMKDVGVKLTRNTFVAEAVLLLSLVHAGPKEKTVAAVRPILFDTSENVFVGGTLLQFDQTQEFLGSNKALPPNEAESLLVRLAGWHDRGNLYGPAGRSYLLLTCPSVEPVPKLTSWPAWRKFWGNANEGQSIHNLVVHRAGDLRTKAKFSLDKLTLEDFRLAAGSPGKAAGPGGKDLGADVDVVGPGPAYERWKKTPYYQEWRKKTKEARKGT